MTYYAWFIVFAVAAYFIVTDGSIAAAFYYVFRLVKAYIQRQWWWITNNPRNPVVKYFMWRRSMKLAKELQKYFDEKNK
jgi:uncharacterized membrane protein YpjA